ncbi:MAG TPA: lytic transglycosylase domain-containing protein [Trebonia sp.]|jgi:hypothetical protein|nr:lytic transglycosylase domain-containing protein [Trebonia sp.]
MLSSKRKARSGLVALAAAGAFSISGATSAAASTLPAPRPAVAHTHTVARANAPRASEEFARAPFSFGDVHFAHARAKSVRVETARTAAVTTPSRVATSGSPQQIARGMLGQYGWSASQFSCLESLWAKESGWSVTASNPGSGAYGIPQALPGSRMASAGPGWRTDAATQIRWGLQYIQGTYGSPSAAWSHEQADDWY